MHKFKYVGAVTNQTVDLDCPLMTIDQGLGFRGREWAYELGLNRITNITRQAREIDFEYSTGDLAELDRMTRIFEADIAAGKPGTFFYGDWRQRGFVVSSSPSSIFHKEYTATAKAVLLDGVWRKPEILGMYPNSGDTDGTKKYSYEYAYEYASTFGVRYVTVDDANPICFSLTIWGYAVYPSIKIADNTYYYKLIIPNNSYLLVDSRPDPTVTLVDQLGKRSDAFAQAERGEGEGSSNYAFQRIPTGTHAVIWDDTFGFDITLWHERSELPNEYSDS